MSDKEFSGFTGYFALIGAMWSFYLIIDSVPEGPKTESLRAIFINWLQIFPLILWWLLLVTFMKYSANHFWEMRSDREHILPRKYLPLFFGFFIFGVPLIQYILQGLSSFF